MLFRSKKETKFFQNNFQYFAGHSLGEYTALTIANVISFEQGLKLLKYRGEFMQSAVPVGEGGMLAVLGTDADEIKKMIDKYYKEIKIYLANDNSNGQLILSGKNEDIEKFTAVLKEKKNPVSHSKSGTCLPAAGASSGNPCRR